MDDPHTRTARPLSLLLLQIRSPRVRSLPPSTFLHSPPSKLRTRRSTPPRRSAENLSLLPPPQLQDQRPFCPLEDLLLPLGRKSQKGRETSLINYTAYRGYPIQVTLRRLLFAISTSEWTQRPKLFFSNSLTDFLVENRPLPPYLVNLLPVLH